VARLLQGIEITTTYTRDEGWMGHVRIKRWYMPFFIAKNLYRHGLPLRYWPLMYWRYYTSREVH
jgi:hypothetical protein